MNLYTKKIGFLCLLLALIFSACETEESIEITSPEPAFVLQQPGISNVFLNFGTPTNAAITMAWNDEVTGSTSYDVEMSLDADFPSTVNLGNVSANSFTISVEELNNAIRNAGASTFRDVAIYVRINAGGTISNAVQYLVTTYPTEVPQMSSPSNNDAFVLSLATLNDIAMTVEWTDPVLSSSLGIDVTYTIEAAASGTDFAAPVTVGTSTNGTSITSTHGDLNAVAIGIGLAADTAGDMDLRIVARNTNSNGNELERTSETITVSVTPYNVSFPYLYMVGDATTPGWDNNNNNTPIFRDQDVPNNYFFTGYFGAGAFKLLETKGQWQPQWGTNDGSTLAVNPGGGSDPGTFNVASAGYYTYSFTTVGESGSFTVTSYDASGSATYTTMGIIGQAIGGWGDGDEINFTQDPNNPHLWYALSVSFQQGEEFLIRANDMWDDVWRYTGSSELYGTALLAGGGDNFPFTEPSGNYDVWFNDLDGGYVIIPN
ncbi:SusE domain-containing protein [Flavivirga algicola]|uniref:SusF/SusE family outer membrane protein n=1 Tax=Flavivirga algicola TaxID=2729136 RepID=A0ABX1RTB1_9FLAO|nr:SusE domain-containing protein [Flavivirga algicola]NMH86786.1 SusF/SusE family outer membrane protein [Flavivirga algicola]